MMKRSLLLAYGILCWLAPAVHADASFESMMASTIRIYCIGTDGSQGSGSGFVVGRRDHVVTNWHVVECSKDGGKIKLLLSSVPRETVDAEVERYDEHKDLAVLKLATAIDKPAVTFTSVASVAVRDPITAVGFPGGADRDERVLHIPILDDGQVTKIYPPPPPGTEQAVQLVMHKATINPGNSGGPLFDLYGRVVGANTQKDLVVVATIGEDGQPQLERVVRGDNLGWAVVSDALFPMLDELRIPYSVDNDRPGALRNLWHREPLLTGTLGTMLLFMLALTALVTNQRGRAVVRDGMTRAYASIRKRSTPRSRRSRGRCCGASRGLTRD